MSVIEPQTHELRGNLLFDEYGDQPYWALRSIYHEIGGGAKNIEVDVDGETWSVSLSYQNSGLEPRVDDDVEQLYEYRMNAYGDGERKIPILIQPRLGWQDEDRAPKSVPNDLGKATNVSIQTATNVDPAELRDLFPRILQGTFDELGVTWSDRYFTGDLHKHSGITTWELYVRVQRDLARKLVKMEGILWRMFHLLGDLEGSKFVYSNDNTEILGYNHQLRLDRNGASELLPGRQHGKQFKHYHPQFVRGSKSEDDPLYHPKFGVLFKSSWNNGNSVRWSERGDLRDELHDNLINVLEWADIPTEPGHWFVADEHFDAAESDRQVTLCDDPTPSIEASQESVLTKTLLSVCDSERDMRMLKEVARTDGGEVHVDDLEDEVGSTSTIYRALSTLHGVLESDNGNVRYLSEKMRRQVREILEVTDDVIESKMHILEETLSIDPRDFERAGRAWQNWLNRYAAEFVGDRDDDSKDRIRIRELLSMFKAGPGEYVGDVIDLARIAWEDAGRDPGRFADCLVEVETLENGKVTRPVRKLRALH